MNQIIFTVNNQSFNFWSLIHIIWFISVATHDCLLLNLQVLSMLVSQLVLHHSLTSMILTEVLELQQRVCDPASTLNSLLSFSNFTPPTRNPHIAYQHPTHVTPTHICIHSHICPCSTYSPLFLLLTVCLSSDCHVIRRTSSRVGTDVTVFTVTVGNKVYDQGLKNKVKQQHIFHVWGARQL